MLFDLVINPTDVDPATVVDAARAAERAGFDGVWTYDHLSGAVLDGSSIPEVWTTLGAIGAATSRVTVGPLVANATTRHPAALAVAAATLQQITEGRAMLGLGAGAGPESPFADELTMLGVEAKSAATRRAIVEEVIGVIRHLWRGDADLVGQHFSLHDASGFIRPDPPPAIIVGANGPKMAALAGRTSDGVNFRSSDEALEDLVATARAAANGRDLLMTIACPLVDEWLSREHPNRQRMASLRVDRLMLTWTGDHGISSIHEAGELINSEGHLS